MLTIAYDPGFFPLAWQDDRKACGPIVDRSSEVFSRAGLVYQFRPIRLPEMIPSLLAGEIQIITGIVPNAQRHQYMNFTRAIAVTGAGWFKLARTSQEKHVAKSTRNRIVTPTAGPLFELISTEYPQLSVTGCDDYHEALDMVLEGKADAAALNIHVGEKLCQNEYEGLFAPAENAGVPIPLAMSIATGQHAGLIDKLNMHIPDHWSADLI